MGPPFPPWPLDPKGGTIVPAVSTEWSIHESFDTDADCESGRIKLRGQGLNPACPPDPTADPRDCLAFMTAMLSAKCTTTDAEDPQLAK